MDSPKEHIGKGFNFDSMPVNRIPAIRSAVKQLLAEVEQAPASRGKKYLKIHYSGITLTQREMIIAKCCDCCGYWVDGRIDCEVEWCVFYKFMPYKDTKRT
jgi:hypothetical protein